MPERIHYPIPKCPSCGKHAKSYCLQTYYSQDGQTIIRCRQCSYCESKWHTAQPIEQLIHVIKGSEQPANYRRKRSLFKRQIKMIS